jgi:hypothetical protein
VKAQDNVEAQVIQVSQRHYTVLYSIQSRISPYSLQIKNSKISVTAFHTTLYTTVYS